MRGLGDWVPRLSGVDLPVLRATVADLQRLRLAEDQVTARDLAGIMLRDPLMAVKVLRFSQSRLTHRQPTEVTTLEHAIMMHGVAPFFREFQNLSALEDTLAANPLALDGALAVMSRAYHAAVNARNFAALRHDMEGEEVTVSALLHDLAELLLWSMAPSIAVQIERMVACNAGLRSVAAQRAVLGFALGELQLALAREWQLPRLLHTLMDDSHWENPRVQTVRLSVAIARHSAHGWHDPALPDDHKALQGLLNLPTDGARKWVKQSALQAAKQWRAFGVRPAAAWLPCLPGDRPVPEPPAAATPEEGSGVVDMVLGQLERAGSSVEQKAVIALAIYALEFGLALSRIWVGQASDDSGRVEPRQHLFQLPGLAPAELAFDPGSGGLFDRLLERGQAWWHDPPRTSNAVALLPAALREKLGAVPFFAMALRPQRRAPLLIYADAGRHGALTEDGYNAFKRVCLTLGAALERATD
jgi:HD-like signal output (HDOD) protein